MNNTLLEQDDVQKEKARLHKDVEDLKTERALWMVADSNKRNVLRLALEDKIADVRDRLEEEKGVALARLQGAVKSYRDLSALITGQAYAPRIAAAAKAESDFARQYPLFSGDSKESPSIDLTRLIHAEDVGEKLDVRKKGDR